jgi:murein L,D-transpeptidase YcbB/YkuD
MRRGLSALEHSIQRDRLARLLLTLIAELGACTPAGLVSMVSGHSAPGAEPSLRNVVLDTLLTLEIQDLIQTEQDQIVISDKGRRQLKPGPWQGLLPPGLASACARLRIACLIVGGELRHAWVAACVVALQAVQRTKRRVQRQAVIVRQSWQRRMAPTLALQARSLLETVTKHARQARAVSELVPSRAVNLLQTYRVSLSGVSAPDRRAAALCALALLAMPGIVLLFDEPARGSRDAEAFVGSERDPGPDPLSPLLVAVAATAQAVAPDEVEAALSGALPPGREPLDRPPEPIPTSSEEPPLDPLVASIRARLADAALNKGVAAKDLAALQSFYAERDRPLWLLDHGLSPKARDLIGEIRAAEDWGLAAEAFELPTGDRHSPDDQVTDEIKLGIAALKYARQARGGRISPASLGKLIEQKPNLEDPRTLLSEIAVSADPAAFLRALHPQHEQFQRLRATLNQTRSQANARGWRPEDRQAVQLLIVNMERWRWMPAALGAYYVWNNIPAFSVRVIKHGQPIYAERTVVGQVKYPTPVFSGQMRSIVFNPKWVVPATIKREDLQPRLRQRGFFGQPDTSVLRQYQLSVSYQGQPVDAGSVDWERANIHQFTFTQPPGPNNVLGKLKFNFPNRHAIYMHDTLETELFNAPVRAGSHGCIRVREPERLAALLLAEDKGWTAQQVETKLGSEIDTMVPLNRAVPVHLVYFTAVVDEVGTIESYADIYGIDAMMGQALFGNKAIKPAPSTVDPNIGKPRRDPWRSIDRYGDLTAAAITGLFGN